MPRQANVETVVLADHPDAGLPKVLELRRRGQHLVGKIRETLDVEKVHQQTVVAVANHFGTGAVFDASTVAEHARAFMSDQERTNGTVK